MCSTQKFPFVFDVVRDHSLTLISCCPCRNMLSWRWSLRVYLRWMHATISHFRWTSRKYVRIACCVFEFETFICVQCSVRPLYHIFFLMSLLKYNAIAMVHVLIFVEWMQRRVRFWTTRVYVCIRVWLALKLLFVFNGLCPHNLRVCNPKRLSKYTTMVMMCPLIFVEWMQAYRVGAASTASTEWTGRTCFLLCAWR